MDRRPAKINRFSEGQGRITYLTVDQVNRLVECAKADGNAQIYPFIVIGLETAMRKSEILSIRREDIDLQRRVIFIPKAKAAHGNSRSPNISASFWRPTQAALQPGNPWLFPSPRREDRAHEWTCARPFRRVVAAAELDPDQILRHTLRHTAITHLGSGRCRPAHREADQRTQDAGDGRAVRPSERRAHPGCDGQAASQVQTR
jgi:integrase